MANGNYSYVMGRQANGQRIIQQVQRGALPEIVAVNMANSVAAAISGLDAKVSQITKDVASAIQNNAIVDSYLRDANLHLAHGAQQAIIDGWRETLPVGAPGYRAGSDPNKDRLSGYLGRALASDDMVRGTTARTISFINVATLNNDARHWYRVNYGAFGPRANPERPASYPVTAEGHTLFVLRDEAPPAPNSWLPRNWVSEGPRWFKPTEGPADVHGGGHRAALFTDLGFRYLAGNFYPTYDNMLRRYAQSAIGQVKLGALNIDVNTNVSRSGRPTVQGR